MESLTIFGWDVGQIFVMQTLQSLIRLVILLFIGIPAIYLLSKWIRKYVTKKLSAQQGMIFSKLVLSARRSFRAQTSSLKRPI